MRIWSFGGLAASLLLAAGSAAFAQSSSLYASGPYASRYPLGGEQVEYLARHRGAPSPYYGVTTSDTAAMPPPASIHSGPGSVNPYQAAAEAPEGSGVVGGLGGECYPAIPYSAGSPWFFGLRGLYMTRDCDDDIALSVDTAYPDRALLSTRDAGMDWAGGFEARFGRYFNCGRNAVEVVYWGLFPETQEACPCGSEVTGSLSSAFSYGPVMFDSGYGYEPVDNVFGDSAWQVVRRSYEFHNVEVNLLGNPCAWVGNGMGAGCCDPCAPRMRLGWLAGVRWIRFSEGMEFAAGTEDYGWDDSLFVGHHSDITNDLLGFQLGANFNYDVTCRFQLTAGVKGGIYGNRIGYTTHIGGPNGLAWIEDANSGYDGREFAFSDRKTDVSFVGELEVGGRYQVTNCWSANFGYRAVALTGLGLVTEQFPDFNNLRDLDRVDSCGSMILHGAYAGVEYNW
jgi:hypothetical protein